LTLDSLIRTDDSDRARTVASSRSARAVARSFEREWSYHDYDLSRTWHQDLEDRRQLFLREVDRTPAQMRDVLVLDAGCGNGSLSYGITQFGAEVCAIDVSNSVESAHHYYRRRGAERLHFLQGDLTHPPFRPGCFAIVYSSGVLHHNPDTREAFGALVPCLAPGGRFYVWLYHREPGLKFALQLRLRSLIAPLPAPIKHGFVALWSLQSIIRQRFRAWWSPGTAEPQLAWRERMVDLLDIYTPRYRWMHTQEEVYGWYEDLGFCDVKCTEVRQWGFGVLGSLGPEVAEPAADLGAPKVGDRENAG
jgi:SAM-dependent methyltransferase